MKARRYKRSVSIEIGLIVSSHNMKARHYKRSVSTEIGQIVSSHNLTTFQAVVRKAQTVTY